MNKLKWFDWLFIIITALLLLPVFVYVYGTLIFGSMGWSDEQKGLICSMTFSWVFILIMYILIFANRK